MYHRRRLAQRTPADTHVGPSFTALLKSIPHVPLGVSSTGHHYSEGGGGAGMTPWCVVLVYSWRRLLADRHSPPFPWTLSLHRQWCPSASHHPVTFLFLPALTFPLPFPFLSLGLSLRRLWPLTTPPLSIPLVGCANGAPGLALFHFFASSPRRGRQMPSPLARCVQAAIPSRR